jgi:hypothetical protein
MRVKDWETFQHYKNRKPPWIRLYRDLLDDDDFYELPDSAVRHLLMFWLIASEDPKMTGNLPTIKKLAFRLRTTQQKVKKSISQLSHYLEDDASTVLADCEQVATPETETEERQRRGRGETEALKRESEFDAFWTVYPRKVGKKAARKSFDAACKDSDWPGVEAVLSAVCAAQDGEWRNTEPKYIPHPATWLNRGSWSDEAPKSGLQQMFDEIDAEAGNVIDAEFAVRGTR